MMILRMILLGLLALPMTSWAWNDGCGYGEQQTSYVQNNIRYVGCVPIPGYYELTSQGKADSAQRMLDAMGKITKQYKRDPNLYKDPQIQKYLKGYWTFTHVDENQNERKVAFKESCAATFIQATGYENDGFMEIEGFGGSETGAMLIFSGGQVPTPKTPEKVTVTLTQTGEKPQTVKALNYRRLVSGVVPWGVIVLEVPTLEDALAGMDDKKSFGIAIDGKTLAQVNWHGGLAARDKLRECESQRTASAKK
ncbi:MAG: hypothetical protein ABL931_17120 [Usitatibacteraceae bacterium]